MVMAWVGPTSDIPDVNNFFLMCLKSFPTYINNAVFKKPPKIEHILVHYYYYAIKLSSFIFPKKIDEQFIFL